MLSRVDINCLSPALTPGKIELTGVGRMRSSGAVARVPLERRHAVAVLGHTWPCHVAALKTHGTSGLGQPSLLLDTRHCAILLVLLLPQGEETAPSLLLVPPLLPPLFL